MVNYRIYYKINFHECDTEKIEELLGERKETIEGLNKSLKDIIINNVIQNYLPVEIAQIKAQLWDGKLNLSLWNDKLKLSDSKISYSDLDTIKYTNPYYEELTEGCIPNKIVEEGKKVINKVSLELWYSSKELMNKKDICHYFLNEIHSHKGNNELIDSLMELYLNKKLELIEQEREATNRL